MTKNVLKCFMMVMGFATLLTVSANAQTEKGLKSCYSLVYPVTLDVPAQGKKVVKSDKEFDATLDRFYASTGDEFLNAKEEDVKDVKIVFPIRVKKADGTTVQVKNEEQLTKIYDECYPEEETAEIEEAAAEPTPLYTINYPVTLIAPNGKKTVVNSEAEESKVMDAYKGEDEDFFNFTYQFPISITKADGTKVTVRNEKEFGKLFGGEEE